MVAGPRKVSEGVEETAEERGERQGQESIGMKRLEHRHPAFGGGQGERVSVANLSPLWREDRLPDGRLP